VISNVALGASDDIFEAGTINSNHGRITIKFCRILQTRGTKKHNLYIDRIRSVVKDIPGAENNRDKGSMGPPVGPPINVEFSGKIWKNS